MQQYSQHDQIRTALHLTADQVIQQSVWSLWIKTHPTKIRPFTEQDKAQFGPFITDREGRQHKVEIGECLCEGPQHDRWTSSLESVRRDRYPISLPDEEGFRLYQNRHPRPVKATHIPEPFLLDCQDGQPPLQCFEEQGGYITWNGETGSDRDLRVEQGSIFHTTYAHYTLIQRWKTYLTPLLIQGFSLKLFLARSLLAINALRKHSQ